MSVQAEKKIVAMLWQDDNGQVICQDHAGTYLTTAIGQFPRRKSHRTPLGAYIGYDIARYNAEGLGEPDPESDKIFADAGLEPYVFSCEYCGAVLNV